MYIYIYVHICLCAITHIMVEDLGSTHPKYQPELCTCHAVSRVTWSSKETLESLRWLKAAWRLQSHQGVLNVSPSRPDSKFKKTTKQAGSKRYTHENSHPIFFVPNTCGFQISIFCLKSAMCVSLLSLGVLLFGHCDLSTPSHLGNEHKWRTRNAYIGIMTTIHQKNTSFPIVFHVGDNPNPQSVASTLVSDCGIFISAMGSGCSWLRPSALSAPSFFSDMGTPIVP
jgi:hypothetical protein